MLRQDIRRMHSGEASNPANPPSRRKDTGFTGQPPKSLRLSPFRRLGRRNGGSTRQKLALEPVLAWIGYSTGLM